MSLGRKAGKGFVSYLVRNILEKIMGIIAMVFLARKLTPYDFGLVSITEVLLSLISVLGTTGLAEFLLAYRKDDKEDIFKAAFWFNIVVTCIIVCIFFLLAPLWSTWQHDEKIRNIAWLVGGIFVFSQLQSIPKAWLGKNLMFDVQVRIQAPFIVLIPIAKIVAVFAGFGVYSLLVPTLFFQPLLTIILYKSTTIRPTLNLCINRWKEIYHFTKHLIGATIFSRITDQADKFILAKFLGLEQLGIYNIAYQLADVFTAQLVQVSNIVLSSVLPKYAHDKDLLYKRYMAFLKTFSFFTFPVLALMFITAEPVLHILYGKQWLQAVLPMQILTVAAALRAVTSSYGSVMNSLHLNKKSFIVTAVYMPFHIIASFLGSMFGVVGLAAGVAIVKAIFTNWNILQIMRVLSEPLSDWYKQLFPFFFVNSSIVISVLLFRELYSISISSFVYIVLAITWFMMLYVVVFRTIYKSQVKVVSTFLSSTFPKTTPYFNIIFGV